ncbi:MAG TPA: leucyl/phenylalanyl-tRNA--protein transferase [Longimicrobiales bacterium]|nr:leucyl/phenylalanyl-tRNA--protein transferase [Longimicrobiales bacterium]
MIPWLRSGSSFPPITAALSEPNGLLAAGGELSATRLLEAYEHGIFPWYAEGQPILWWSPDPRMVLFIQEFRITRSLRKVVRRGTFEIRVDTAFRDVVEGCAETPRPNQSGTWITPAVVKAYHALYLRGHAHSIEAWHKGCLAGGLYGVSIGSMFFGESMFARETDASKVALVALVAMMKRAGLPMIDCQQETAHLSSFGARPIPRQQFAERLAPLVHSSAPVNAWTPVPELTELEWQS